MVRPNNVARSRACEQCKRKRIKCDLGNPCQRCTYSSLPCSGPITGLFIINKDLDSYETRHVADYRLAACPIDAEGRGNIRYTNIAMPPSHYDELLLWRFLTYFSQENGGKVWTDTLPSLVAAKNKVAMRAAARAVSVAFAAQKVSNPAMVKTACEFYGASLRHHQFSFRTTGGRDICRKKAINAIPVTVLLSYFEMVQATSPDAWFRHTLAAERLFVLIGPEALVDPLLNHLYFIVRTNSAIRCFLLGSCSPLLDERWSNITMLSPCGVGTVAFHRVTAIIGSLSQILQQPKADIHTIEGIIEDLNTLWSWSIGDSGMGRDSLPLVDHEFDRNAILSLELDHPIEVATALTEAFFRAASMLALTLLYRQRTRANMDDPGPETTTQTGFNHDVVYHSQLHHNGSRILRLAQMLQTQEMGCACLRMILPLAIIYRFSPSFEQRYAAEQCFRLWCSSDGLPGLAAFAFGQYKAA